MPRTHRFIYQKYIVYVKLIAITWYTCVPVVSGFQVTKRSQNGDNIFGYLEDVTYATYFNTGKHQTLQEERKLLENETKLIPISTKPLLFVSSGQPLLSPDECNLLSIYFSTKSNAPNGEHKSTLLKGQQTLKNLQRTLDDLIVRQEDTIVEPRYLFYEKPKLSRGTESERLDDHKSKYEEYVYRNILPDGLHVDTNNGKYFRYLTVLVYLTSSHAATVFPLANLDVKRNKDHAILAQAANQLIQYNIQHTRQVVETKQLLTFDQQSKDRAKFHKDLIQDVKHKQSLIEHAITSPDCLRIAPQQGHIAIFVNIDVENGCADPYSFHGSEISMDEKQVLTFFYEIPVHQFTSQNEFGKQVGLRVDRIKRKYNIGMD